MFDLIFGRYDQVLGLAIWGPWVVVAGLAIALFFSIRSGMRWMKWYDKACKKIERIHAAMFGNQYDDETDEEAIARFIRSRYKAEAEARELQAALDENEKKWKARWEAARYPEPILTAPPTLGKSVKKGVPKKKKAPVKKVSKSRARR